MSFLLLVAETVPPPPGTAPRAKASFTLYDLPDITVNAVAPAAAGAFVVKQVPDLRLQGIAPAAVTAFTVMTRWDIRLAGTGPAATASLNSEWDPPEDLILAGTAPAAEGAFAIGWQVIPTMQLEILDPELPRAPAALTVALIDALPGVDVTFAIDGTTVATLPADSIGSIGPVSLAITDTLGSAGTHTVTATQPGANGASATFTILLDPSTYPIARGPDTAPVDIPASHTSTGVRRWVLQDLMPGGLGSYVMPINPRSMSAPQYRKVLQAQHSTATTGSFHIFEGAGAPQEWQLVGYCPNKAMYDTLRAFGDLNRRFYVIDHRGRAWKATFQNVDLVLRRRQHDDNGNWNDWAADYTITAMIYDQDWRVPE